MEYTHFTKEHQRERNHHDNGNFFGDDDKYGDGDEHPSYSN